MSAAVLLTLPILCPVLLFAPDDLYDGYGSVAFSAINDALNNAVGVPQALAMGNLVLDNLNECLTPPQWLVSLQANVGSKASAAGRTQQLSKQAPHATTNIPIHERLLDRFHQLPASHSRWEDKSHAKRIKSNKQFR